MYNGDKKHKKEILYIDQYDLINALSRSMNSYCTCKNPVKCRIQYHFDIV